MKTFPIHRVALMAALAPLALSLAACGKDDSATNGLSGEKIAAVAAPAGKAWADTVSVTPEGGYRMGNPDAPIKLVEFGSLTCSHCAEFSHLGAAQLRDTFVASGRVSWEFRNFVRDPIDIYAAQLIRCGSPESFFPLTDQVFAAQADIFKKAQEAGPSLEAAAALPPEQRGMAITKAVGLDQFFAARGISVDQASACLAKAEDAQALAQRTTDQGEEFDVSGTPTFLINGSKIEENSWPAVKAKLETLGAR